MADNFDIDALLAQGTKDAGSLAPKKESRREQAVPDSVGERVGSFKIDPREAHITGTDKLRREAKSLEQNPEDFTNQVELQKEAKKRRTLFIVLGALIFVLGLGAIVFASLPQTGAGTALAQPRPVDDTSQRFLNLYPDAPTVSTNVSKVSSADSLGVQVNDGYRLTFAGMEWQATGYEAIVPKDFGIAAKAQVEGEWNGTEVYLFKDMAHSRAFENAWDGKEVTVEGAAAAVVMYMDLPGGTKAVLAVVNPDSSGFMIALPANLNYESAENLQNFVRIEQAIPVVDTADYLQVTPANFPKLCRATYGTTPASLGIEGDYGDLKFNSVTILIKDSGKQILGLKSSDGQAVRMALDTETGLSFPLNDETLALGVANGTWSELNEAELAKHKEDLDILSTAPIFKTFEECFNYLDAPVAG